MERGTLTLLDPETGHLAVRASHGLSRGEMRRGLYKVGEGITGSVFASGAPFVVPDIGKEPLFLNRTGSRSGLAKENKLRRGTGGASRERALWPREGRLHRGDRRKEGALRAGRQGHDLPGGDRRSAAAAPPPGRAQPARDSRAPSRTSS
jgi:hypothetical protein